MKLTNQRLRHLIKEELESALNEVQIDVNEQIKRISTGLASAYTSMSATLGADPSRAGSRDVQLQRKVDAAFDKLTRELNAALAAQGTLRKNMARLTYKPYG